MRLWLKLLIVTPFCLASLAGASIPDLFQQGALDLWESRFIDASNHFQSAAATEPSHPLAAVALYNAANVEYLANHDPQKASELYREVAGRYPESVWAAESWRRLAECAESAGNDSQAVDDYIEALKTAGSHRNRLGDPWITDVSMATASILTKLGNQEKAIAYYDQLRQQITVGEPAANIRFSLAEGYESIGELKEAALCYKEIAEFYPQTSVALRLNTKRDLLTKELSYDWSAFDLYQQSSNQVRVRNRAEAGKICQQILDNYPNSPVALSARYRLLVITTYSTGDFKKGIEECVDFIVKHPDWSGNEEIRNAIQAWQAISDQMEYAKSHPEDLAINNSLGFQLLQLRVYDLSQHYFEQALTLAPSDPIAHQGLGYVLSSSGRTAEAMPHFEVSLKSDPDNGTMLNLLGYAYLQAQDFDRARDMFQRYINTDTTNANAYDSMGECLLNAGKYSESISYYQKALACDSTFSNSQFMIGEVYKAAHDTTNAITAYQRYLTMDIGGRLSQLARANLDSLQTTSK
jgi:tetratricopeptide (TPR) repeat protein